MVNGLELVKGLKKALKLAIPVFTIITVVAFFEKDRLPGHGYMDPSLQQSPIQEDISAPPFSFEYMGEIYNVQPMARYEMWGLVVTHNNTTGFLDIYHDETSVDTKDLCLIWGNNLETSDYKKMSFESGAWTCFYQYPFGVEFFPNALSNNHLITADDAVRETIGEVRIGDQVHVKGMLVKYQAESFPEFWRTSSMVRDDTGDGACEVVYVESLEILKRGAAIWHSVFHLGRLIVILLIFGGLAAFVLEIYMAPKVLRSSRWG